jgi:HEPN domain-containing protein
MNLSPEHARLMMEKAIEDQVALERLAEIPTVADAVIGFHAQQAVEKMLKAVLSQGAIPYGRTHDLEHLLDLLRRHKIAPPPDAEWIPALSPFAVDYRYDRLPPEPHIPKRLDRPWTVECVRRIRAWAAKVLELA